MSHHHLTESDRRILAMLTHRVRIATTAQLIALDDDTSARRLLTMRQRNLLRRAVIAVRQPTVDQPLCRWNPGDDTPSAGCLAWQLRKRWQAATPAVTPLWWARPAAARLMGGVGGRLRQPLQIAHDLGVTAVYGKLVTDGRAHNWVGEDLYRRDYPIRRGEKVPDALLIDPDGAITRVIEFGGGYPATRLRAFHRNWSRRQIPYEVW